MSDSTAQAEQLRHARIETDLLLEAILRRYGYDFRGYSRASLDRRIAQFLADEGAVGPADLIPRVLRDPALVARLVRRFSVAVTEMFRDPFVYRAVREQVVPLLRTWPHVKVWHAGCASGEEVYSLAIVLEESDLYRRTTIYATDFNDLLLERASSGIYPTDRIQAATRNYQQAGGTASLADYYHAAYGGVALDAALRERITFASHNLATDSVFAETHLVFCRNVMIYFDRPLQDRVLGLFADSLVHGGFLCLGTREDLQFSAVADRFEVVDAKARIYRKRAA